jgi:molybdopterin-containing oxidoreductase family membrane subunit
MTELRVAAAVFAIGFLVFTVMLKVAVPILLGELQDDRAGATASPLPPLPVGAPAITR